jgi:hypothetical protein
VKSWYDIGLYVVYGVLGDKDGLMLIQRLQNETGLQRLSNSCLQIFPGLYSNFCMSEVSDILIMKHALHIFHVYMWWE